MRSERIAKVIARFTKYSRRDAERLIDAGRVSCDGQQVIGQGGKCSALNVLKLDETVINTMKDSELQLFRFNKPRNCLVTTRDPTHKALTIYDILEPQYHNLVSIGRLDSLTDGLLLLTNDGGFKRHLELPSNNWQRIYQVRVSGDFDPNILDEMVKGVKIERDNGQVFDYKGIDAEVLRSYYKTTDLQLTLTEGKNREIREIMRNFGLRVIRLTRLAFGPYRLADIEPGEIRKVQPSTIGTNHGGFREWWHHEEQ